MEYFVFESCAEENFLSTWSPFTVRGGQRTTETFKRLRQRKLIYNIILRDGLHHHVNINIIITTSYRAMLSNCPSIVVVAANELEE